MRSLHEHQAHPLLKKPHVITLVDFRINCNLPRLWTIDLRDGNVGFREPATHGKRSGPKNSPALRTSNVKGSNQSCVGAFITRHTRMSKAGQKNGKGLALVIEGLDPTNDNARRRKIIFHGAWYISKSRIRKGKVGRSHGCFATEQSVNDTLIPTISDGTFVYAYNGGPA